MNPIYFLLAGSISLIVSHILLILSLTICKLNSRSSVWILSTTILTLGFSLISIFCFLQLNHLTFSIFIVLSCLNLILVGILISKEQNNSMCKKENEEIGTQLIDSESDSDSIDERMFKDPPLATTLNSAPCMPDI